MLAATTARTDGARHDRRASARAPPPHQLLDDRPRHVQPHPPGHQDVVRRAAAVQHAEQHVLGADVVVPERDRLAQRQLQRLPAVPREGDVTAPPPAARTTDPVQRARAERLLGAAADLVEVDAQRGERGRVWGAAGRARSRSASTSPRRTENASSTVRARVSGTAHSARSR